MDTSSPSNGRENRSARGTYCEETCMWLWKVRLGRFVGTAPKATLIVWVTICLLHVKLTARTRVYGVSIMSRKKRVSFCLSGWSTHRVWSLINIYSKYSLLCNCRLLFAAGIPVTVVREKRWMFKKNTVKPSGKREFHTRFWEETLPFFF